MKKIVLSIFLVLSPGVACALTGDQEFMRQCVDRAIADPEYAEVDVQSFCVCVDQEWDRDFTSRPDYFTFDRSQGFYSEKLEREVAARVSTALRGHVSYCRSIN